MSGPSSPSVARASQAAEQAAHQPLDARDERLVLDRRPPQRGAPLVLERVVDEGFARRHVDAYRTQDGQALRVIGMLEDHGRDLVALDELFDQDAAESREHAPGLGTERRAVLDARPWNKPDAGVAVVVLGEEREAQRLARGLDLGPIAGKDMRRGRQVTVHGLIRP
jgi:hypothetical protein